MDGCSKMSVNNETRPRLTQSEVINIEQSSIRVPLVLFFHCHHVCTELWVNKF